MSRDQYFNNIVLTPPVLILILTQIQYNISILNINQCVQQAILFSSTRLSDGLCKPSGRTSAMDRRTGVRFPARLSVQLFCLPREYIWFFRGLETVLYAVF
jgi:hypothetical protein